MSMERLTKAERVAAVPQRWAKQYDAKYEARDPRKREIGDALRALAPGFDAETVNTIIGNTSWTELSCGICEQDVPAVVRFEYFEDSICVCRDCLSSALDLLSRPSHGREGTE